ncbi:MAG: 3-isopropylmalate dehydratase small subunit [Terriglobales bacterium]
MNPFRTLTSTVAPLDRAAVDTDQIIPKQFLKTTSRTGLGAGLFFDWRRQPDFVLNQPQYRGAQILAAGREFGCGSSREHAVWALLDYGFRCVIAPSFGDIFYNNCSKNGLLALRLDAPELLAEHPAPLTAAVNLEGQQVDFAGRSTRFEIDPFRKRCLLEGLDEIALTLAHAPAIAAYEEAHR